MTGSLLLGLAFGSGVMLVAGGLRTRRPRLDEALARRPMGDRSAVARVIDLADTRIGGVHLERELRLTGGTRERHALEKIVTAGVLAGFVIGLALVLSAAAIALPWGLVIVGASVAGVIGFFVPDLTLRARAAERRREFRHALSAYLDLVVIVVAGGGGTESALHDAAAAGSGWAFDELRRSVEGARLSGVAPWSALDRLGDELGVAELKELASGVSLAGEHGARVQASLATKARALRERLLTEAETEAQQATERMSVPVVLLLFGFLAFVLYPALTFVLEGL